MKNVHAFVFIIVASAQWKSGRKKTWNCKSCILSLSSSFSLWTLFSRCSSFRFFRLRLFVITAFIVVYCRNNLFLSLKKATLNRTKRKKINAISLRRRRIFFPVFFSSLFAASSASARNVFVPRSKHLICGCSCVVTFCINIHFAPSLNNIKRISFTFAFRWTAKIARVFFFCFCFSYAKCTRFETIPFFALVCFSIVVRLGGWGRSSTLRQQNPKQNELQLCNENDERTEWPKTAITQKKEMKCKIKDEHNGDSFVCLWTSGQKRVRKWMRSVLWQRQKKSMQ